MSCLPQKELHFFLEFPMSYAGTKKRQPPTSNGVVLRRGRAALNRLFSSHFIDCPFGFELCYPDGDIDTFGNGSSRVRFVMNNPGAVAAIRSLDEGRIAQAFMNGEIDIEGDFMSAMDLRQRLHNRHPVAYAWRFVQPLLFGQVKTNSRAIQHHYDVGPDFYHFFMDKEVPCYTQGIFEHDDERLAVATRRKFDFCIERCKLGPGSEILEVGPGWGAFTSHASQRGIEVTGVTNSQDSKNYVDHLGAKLGMRWRMILGDILRLKLERRFDAIVVMGVMEHLPNYAAVLSQFERLLQPGGFIYLDASASRRKYEASSFTYNHIYPGNHSFFVLHDFLTALAHTRFHLRGVYDDRRSYFLTFRQWALNFDSHRPEIIERFGERHFRRFQLYLWGSAHSFLNDVLQCYRVVIQAPTA
jgi:cyclopropane-fatty-acyl-phospholipid synthase